KLLCTSAGAIAALAMAFLTLSAAIPASTTAADPAPQAPHRKKHPKAAPTPNVLPPNVKAQLTPYRGGPVPYHEGEQFVFQASWLGIPAATGRFLLHTKKKDQARWVVEGWVQTSAFADLFFKMRDYVKEDFSKQDLAPGRMLIQQRENKRIDDYTVNF